MARRVAREEYEHLCWMIKKWNRDRLELFEITMPNENLEFEGIMRFYFQSNTKAEVQKVATKCIRVSNTANTGSVIEALVQKFRPDLRMLSSHSSYALYEVHSNEEERRMESDEYPLMVQLGWVNGEREGRFLLRLEPDDGGRKGDNRNAANKRPAKRGKKVKRESLPEDVEGKGKIARSLYHVMPESKFTRSISKKNERNGRMHGREAAEDTLRVYADSLLPNGPCKSLLISAHDTCSEVVKSSLEKYGITEDPSEFCLVQVVIPSGQASESNPQLNMDYSEFVLGDNERPLEWKEGGGGGGRGDVVQFHLRRKDSFSFMQRPHSSSHSRSRSQSPDDADDLTLPALVEIFLDAHPQQRPRRFLLSSETTEIGSSAAFSVGNSDPRGHLCLTSASIKPRHCLIQLNGQSYTITPLDKSALIFINGNPVHGSYALEHNSVVRLGEYKLFRFFAPIPPPLLKSSGQNSISNHGGHGLSSHAGGGGDVSRAKSVENIRNSHLVDEIQQSSASRRLRGKAYSEYDLQAQMVGEEDEEEEGERKERERKRSDTRTHSQLDNRHLSPRKRHPSAPQSSFNPSTTSSSNGALADTDRGEWITPLSLSFHQNKQPLLLKKMVTEVDCHQIQFKLGPAYGLYMMAQHMYGAEFKAGPGSTLERRKTIVAGLKSISSHIKKAVKECRSDPGALAFWLANSSELLHFLQQDYQLGPLSNDYDIPFTHTIHLVYKYFVSCMIKELSVFLPAFYDESTEADREDTPGGYNSGPESVLNRVGGGTEPDRSKVIRHSSISYNISGSKVSKRGRSTIHDVLQTLSSTITLLKRCHVNVTLSVMVFSNLFRYISTKVFNRLVGGEVRHCGRLLGQRLSKRLGKVKGWAEREGMELPAHTHLEMVVEAANLLQASKKYSDNAHAIYNTCPHLNSIQVSTLLELCLATDGEAVVTRAVVDNLIHLARSRDEILQGDGLEVRVEEDNHPELLFHIPGEGYSGEVMNGVPSGLQEFLQPMISAGLCKLTVSKESSGVWCPPVRNVTSSQSMDHSVSSQNADSPHNFNTLPKTGRRSRKSSADGEVRHNTLPRNGDTDLKFLKVSISKDSNNTLGISIVEAKLNANSHFGGETGIFIKSMVEGGPAQMDGRLRPGDQILEVDGNDLLDCTQDRASHILRTTGKKVTLMVAKMAAQYYGLSHVMQSSPRYKNAPEGSSYAKKAARKLKREQKERQRQERGYTTEFRLERKQLDQHQSDHSHLSPITQQSSVTSSSAAGTDPRFANHPQIAKWVMEQNSIFNPERGSEAEGGPGSNSPMSNTADTDTHASSPVPSFTTSSSRRTKSSYDRHRTGSPPERDTSRLPSRLHEGHSVSPFDALDSLEAQTMSDSASKFSDYSAEPEYNVPPPQSAPPVSTISYKDAFNTSNSLCSQQMSSSLTPYGPSQQMDKLSTDVMYHTPQSGASLSGISSIMPRLLQGRGGKPYLGRVHLKELDGDEIDLEKQRIKLMFYEKKNEERVLREEEEISSQAQDAPSPATSRKVYPSSPPGPPPVSTAHKFEIPTSLEEGHGNGFSAFSDPEVPLPDPKKLLEDLETLEHMASEQRRRCKELSVAREKENLDLKRAEVEFKEQELLDPGPGTGGTSVSMAQQERWQKEHKKRLRHLERYRLAQRDKMRRMDADERHATAKLEAYEYQIYEIRQQLEAIGNHRSSSVAIVESHLQSYGRPSERSFSRTTSGCSTSFPGDMQAREDKIFQTISEVDEAKPEREWPQQDHQKTNPARFVSTESINSSSVVGTTEVPEFSREIVNTISESTNMTEPTQDDVPIPTSGWGSKYVANSDDPYAGEYASKYTYSDDEFFMDDRRVFKPEVPHFHIGGEREVQRSPYHHDRQSPRLLNGHVVHGYHENGGGAFVDNPSGDEEFRAPHWEGLHPHSKKKLPPPPLLDRPQNYTSGRTDHHYSRSNRPRLHHRNQASHMSDNLSTVSGISTSSSYFTNQNGDHFKPTSSKLSSPTSAKFSVDGHHLASTPHPHSPGLGPPSPSYSPFRDHPHLPPSTAQHIYSVPNTSSGPSSPAAIYDVPGKGSGKSKTSSPAPAIYDHPRPSTSSPPHVQNHVAPLSPSSLPPSSTTAASPHDPNPHSPFHYPSKPHDRPHYTTAPTHEQHYDTPKPQTGPYVPELVQLPPTLLSSDRDLARQTASNMAAHPYQYHGLPTKPMGPRSYSRGRQDYGADRGARGQNPRPPQRVQRQQTEL